MAAESAAGERFARDMRRIREDRGVSQDDIHQETRIAITLITAFEQDGLFEHPAFNRVYLRSFVRAYAEYIDIDPELALKHLERALAGEYENELAVRILDTTPSMGGYDPEESESSSTESPGDTPSPPSAVDRPLSKQEQEPPAFSPRPIGGATPDASNKNEEQDDTAANKAPETETSQRRSRDTRANEPPDASKPEGTGADALDSDEPDTNDRGAGKPEETENLPDGTSRDEPTADDTDATNSTGATEQDSTDETPPPSLSRPEKRSGTAGGTVFNKRPVKSAEEEANKGGADRGSADRDDTDNSSTVGDTDAQSAAPERGAPEAAAHESEASEEEKPDRTVDDADEESASGEPSPAQRFRETNDGDETGPPPPQPGERVGKPRPVGSATDTTRTARDSHGRMESPMAARSEKERADRDIRVSEVLEENRMLLIGGAAVVGMIVVGLALWFAFSGDADTQDVSTADSQPTQSSDQPTDANEAASIDTDTTTTAQPPLANLALRDTLRLVVEAQSDILGMKIQRDGDVRRPYWIEEGETMAFPFTDRIIVWDNIENVDLYLEQYRYPETQHLDPRGRVVVTRDSAAAFAETVRGPAASFPTPTVRPLDEAYPEPDETPVDADTLGDRVLQDTDTPDTGSQDDRISGYTTSGDGRNGP